jgi:hypothetical protein
VPGPANPGEDVAEHNLATTVERGGFEVFSLELLSYAFIFDDERSAIGDILVR